MASRTRGERAQKRYPNNACHSERIATPWFQCHILIIGARIAGVAATTAYRTDPQRPAAHAVLAMSDGLTWYMGNSGFANGIFLTDSESPVDGGYSDPLLVDGWMVP